MSAIDYAAMARLIRKGKRAEARGKAIAAFFTQLLISALTFMMRGFWLMLAVGIVHHEWWPAIPTIGYWWSVLVVSLLCGVFSAIPSSKKDPS
jgi:hypothetical protein